MLRSAASRVVRVGMTASAVFVLAALLAGCSGETAGSGTREEAKAASAASPKANDDRVTTVEGRGMQIKMVANDKGDSLRIKTFHPGKIMGGVSCEEPMLSCDYIAAPGFTGEEKFEYTVEDAQGRADTAMVYVEVRPKAGSEVQRKPSAPPEARDDRAITPEGREVMIDMVENDTGQSLKIDGFKPGKANGDIICEAGTESGRIQSCAYTPIKGFIGTDEFEYTVKGANGKSDTAMVYVEVEPAN